MKLFSSPSKPPGQKTMLPALQLPNVQNMPAALSASLGLEGPSVKVDLACRFDGVLVVAGWCTGSATLGLAVSTKPLQCRHVSLSRTDVALHFGLDSAENLGFVLVAQAHEDDAVSLTWRLPGDGVGGGSAPLVFGTEPAFDGAEVQLLGPAMGLLALGEPAHSPSWRSLIARTPQVSAPCRSARGFLEGAAASDLSKEGVAFGWVVQMPGTVVWLEDEQGDTYPLEGAFRRFREDVHEATHGEFGAASRDAGFIVRLRGLKPSGQVRLKALSELGVHVLSSAHASTLPIDPVAAARWLFSIHTPMSEMHRRVPLVDEPLLRGLMEHRQSVWEQLPAKVRQLGTPVIKPQVAIVVPLYGRCDFVEHQLIEFAADPWLKANAELVYVIDDPRLVEPFANQAEALHRLYQLPFRWVWGSVNRGFSGANNLGLQHTVAPRVIFLNSDAFPQQTGWAAQMCQALDTRPDLGALGVRLVFPDGAMQHCGMEFQRREELGIWINHHPRMGLDPKLDVHKGLRSVTCVTGACIAVRRQQLLELGAWDAGYLIGDFEDSDLCLKLRNAGLEIGYLPDVQLVHLERQSFKLLGQDEFRHRVVIYNAVRHQTRWQGLIEKGPGAAQPGAWPRPLLTA
ncbi:glycosyltransferase family 2 protein [Aquabacterium sp. J223]|uniref:glycosyltransferase family 2 protein n=1 Tax=Aquabacterium sp. J223 TaxID=2898431 RepID=UPI0021ADAD8E|nr:glycosyltransferase [Aquabacterium sp. J223]UUX94125.1 glycosyltransferase [Aquabacterium sp. J223]